MFLKRPLFIIISALAICSSCSTLQAPKSYDRAPAESGSSCQELAQNLFLKENYQKDLQQSLVDKKLITFTNKFVTVQHPRLDWINRARASLNRSIKNWNNNKYPAFYIFHDEDIVTEAKRYFKTVHSMVASDVDVAPEASKNLELVNGWMKSFENYQQDVDHLLDERISLQYNLSLLKKLKLKDDEVRDIKLTFKKNGQLVEEIVTLRKSDKDLQYQIKKLKTEIKNLDGTLFSNGKIKDRVIRQAMLADILTILQREFEYAVKNTSTPDPELIKELDKINALIKNSKFQPSTYGVYRITNQVFLRELAALSKLDVAYKKFIETPALKLKEIVNAFIQNRPVKNAANPKEAEKIGFFKRVYAKITSITPKQAATGAGVVAVAGLGIERYFWFGQESSIGEDRGHEEQLERTEEEDEQKSEGHSRVIEVEIDELTAE